MNYYLRDLFEFYIDLILTAIIIRKTFDWKKLKMLSQKESYSLEAQNQPQLPSIPSAPPTYSELLATNNRQIIVPSTTIYNPIL